MQRHEPWFQLQLICQMSTERVYASLMEEAKENGKHNIDKVPKRQ
jgi:hypothetical protein